MRNVTPRSNTVADALHADMKIGLQSPALASVTRHEMLGSASDSVNTIAHMHCEHATGDL